MKLFEYQVKQIFEKYEIPVPQAKLLQTVEQVGDVVSFTGLPCVIKAQVLTGGRGKAGLVRIVNSEDDAFRYTETLFKRGVHSILAEEAVKADAEIYLSVSIDPLSGMALLIGCAEGGMEIEHLACEMPEKIILEKIDMDSGLESFQVNDFVYRMGLRGAAFKKAYTIVKALYKIFVDYDAELVEINPLFITESSNVIAGDGKLIIDDNSLLRHPGCVKTDEYYDNAIELEAAIEGMPYLQFDGDISLMCAGAGLANTVYDLINYEGGSVANYLEFGGPCYRKSKRAMELCLKNNPKVILIVTFGTIARADVIAEGIADAMRSFSPKCSVITCIRGTGEEKAKEILAEVGLECLSDTEEAVKKAIAISKRRKYQ